MKKLFTVVLLICFVSTTAFATVPKSQDDFYVYDYADVISYEAEGIIFYNNQALEKACGAQIVVAAVKNTDHSNTRDYAYRLFNEWEVGDEKKDNGFLLLLSIEDEDAFLCQGTGAERIIDAGGITRMMDKYLKDDFFAKRYSDGVLKIFEALFSTVRDFYGINLAFMDEEALTRTGKLGGTAEWDSKPSGAVPDNDVEEGKSVATLLGAIIVIAIIVAIIARPRRKRSAVYTTPAPTVVVTSRPRTRVVRTTRTYRPRSGSFFGSGSTFTSTRSTGTSRSSGWSSSSTRSGSGFSSSSRSSSSFRGSSRSGFSGGRGGGGSSRGSGGGFSRGR